MQIALLKKCDKSQIFLFRLLCIWLKCLPFPKHISIYIGGTANLKFFEQAHPVNFFFGHTPQNTKVSASRKTTLEFIMYLKMEISKKEILKIWQQLQCSIFHKNALHSVTGFFLSPSVKILVPKNKNASMYMNNR
jgi:hypothetical protein